MNKTMNSPGDASTLPSAAHLERLQRLLLAVDTTLDVNDPHPRLVRLFVLIANSPVPLSNSQIKELTGIPLPGIARHLGNLKEAGLISTDVVGRSYMNTLTPSGHAVASRLAQVVKAF